MYADPKFRPLPLEAVTWLQEGRLTEAIKAVREAEDLGQKEARRRVEAYIAHEPLLAAQLEFRQRARRRKFFLWFLLIDVLIAAGVIYWLLHRAPA